MAYLYSVLLLSDDEDCPPIIDLTMVSDMDIDDGNYHLEEIVDEEHYEDENGSCSFEVYQDEVDYFDRKNSDCVWFEEYECEFPMPVNSAEEEVGFFEEEDDFFERDDSDYVRFKEYEDEFSILATPNKAKEVDNTLLLDGLTLVE
ncbi:unnamed protein product [Mucor hiemalis]